MMKVAFQGEHGAYSELAAMRHFGKKIDTVPCRSFTEVFQSVEKRKTKCGIVPLENSIEGSVGQNYDLLSKTSLGISGETVLRIEHCLIGFPKATTKSIKKVYSHPQALGQCRIFLEKLHVEQIPVYDTAGSVKMVKESGKKEHAGIASELAANTYKMKILEKEIENDPNNFTRFVIISKEKPKKTGNDKTSLLVMLKHDPGALYGALGIFSKRHINLVKLESRPITGKPWEYNFYIDLEGHIQDKNVKEAIAELKKKSSLLKVFGSYPRSKITIAKRR